MMHGSALGSPGLVISISVVSQGLPISTPEDPATGEPAGVAVLRVLDETVQEPAEGVGVELVE